ncbi:sensor histidine kinase [Pedobacter cryophilus]|uniref:histidine kinase n=1 Tax=Pedobacter cryophilus TaxID=2571271 RepID=A0A4U1BYT1_9SPHI|nr:PAS domain-containing sensor histidine kinase [Pedobacter cryophilus]TKB97638.1 PAS domain S-box protein [Pedobacter cryophilus]
MNKKIELSLSTLCENVSMGVIVTNDDGVIVMVNRFLLKQFGYTEDELINTTIENLIPNKFLALDPREAKTNKQNFIDDYAGLEIEVTAIKKDGTQFPVEISFDYSNSNEGNYIIVLVNDISKRKKAELDLIELNAELEKKIEERTQSMSQTVKTLAKLIAETEVKDAEIKRVNSFLKNILNFTEAILFVTDSEGIIKMFNTSAETHLGYNANEVIDKTTPIIFFDKEELEERQKELTKEFKKEIGTGFSTLFAKTDMGLPNEYEFSFVRKDGSKFPVLLTLNRIGGCGSHSSKEGYIGFCKDISKRKEAEIEMKKVLEKEKELSDLRFKFLSLASHEFRTPLSVILSSAFIISQYKESKDHDKREKHVKRIVSSTNLLKDILNDFLSISKIEEGKIQVRNTSFNLKTHIKEIINELNGLLKKDQIIIYRHEGDVNLFLDAGMLKHIVINLLSNAIKFSQEGSAITISTKKHDREFTLVVKDRGVGISDEDKEHLFDRFFRGSNASQIQGTGLGLHIVSKYVEQMDGKLECKSKLGIGTRIEVSFHEIDHH